MPLKHDSSRLKNFRDQIVLPTSFSTQVLFDNPLAALGRFQLSDGIWIKSRTTEPPNALCYDNFESLYSKIRILMIGGGRTYDGRLTLWSHQERICTSSSLSGWNYERIQTLRLAVLLGQTSTRSLFFIPADAVYIKDQLMHGVKKLAYCAKRLFCWKVGFQVELETEDETPFKVLKARKLHHKRGPHYAWVYWFAATRKISRSNTPRIAHWIQALRLWSKDSIKTTGSKQTTAT